MTTALILAAISAAWLIPIGVRRVIRRFKKVQATFDTIVDLGTADDLQIQADLEADEADHIARLAPALEFVPDGFTCLGCHETDALPDSIWCAVCSERVANFPSEPIERGQR